MGSNGLGAVSYGYPVRNYTNSMVEGDHRTARKHGVDGFMGALMMTANPLGLVVGGVGLYVNYYYHSDSNNP
jgi:hypothetical protein